MHGLSDNQIRYILQLEDGRMVFTTSGNVNLYDGARFKQIHRTSEHIFPLHQYDGFYRIYKEADSLLWIKDQHKLYCIQLPSEQYHTDLTSYFQAKGVNAADDFFVDELSRKWLLTAEGLWLVDSNKLFTLSTNSGKLQDLLTEGDYLYLFYHTGEVVCYHLTTQERLYGSLAYSPSEQEDYAATSLVVKGSDGFYQLRNGRRGGLFYFNPDTRSWKQLLNQAYALNTLIVSPEEVIYVSCANGIWIVNPRTGQKEYLPTLQTVKGEALSTEISTLFHDEQGGFWVGTFNRGLLYYHPLRYKFAYLGRSSFLNMSGKELIVQGFAEDSEGNVYIKSHSDYYCYPPLSDLNQPLRPLLFEKLPSEVRQQFTQSRERHYQGNWYTALCTDSRGWVWAGTPDGLELYVGSHLAKRTFYMEDGLSNNFVQAILEDSYQNIWVTTSQGISKIQVDSLTHKIRFINYNQFDGTLEGEYAPGALFEAADGRLFFGGIDGFNMLSPFGAAQTSLFHSSPSLPYTSTALPHKPLFVGLRLFGEKVEQGKTYSNRVLLPRESAFTNQIKLAYHQNFLTFEFSALNFCNQAQTFYRYQLEGIDKGWQEASVGEKGDRIGTNGVLLLAYTNLPSGDYKLKVMASDNNLEWGSAVTEIAITIDTPWWRTKRAYLLYVVLLLLLVYGGVHLYVSITKRRLKQKHKEEILLLRIKNLIEQCSQYENKKEAAEETFKKELVELPEEVDEQSPKDAAFLAQAMELVERNLDNSNYSVEQLSRDLCMERTGLYRKLNGMIEQSPTLFIRNIRLQRAAQLLKENELTIAEIAERTGFSSSSYFSKCFQSMYGCKPSEYVNGV